MSTDSDGITEAFEGQVRVLVTAAGHVGERVARAREESLRRAQAVSEQQTRQLASRIEAERRAARVELGAVHREEWWDRADPEQIGRMYQVARAWSDHDPEAQQAEARIREQVHTRYGIDVTATGADPAAVRAAVERAEHDRGQAEAERDRQGGAERAEAQVLMAGADQADRAGERAHTAAYDSDERRAAFAEDMRGRGIEPEVVEARIRADLHQAKPAIEATKAPSARKAQPARPAHSRGVQIERGGLER